MAECRPTSPLNGFADIVAQAKVNALVILGSELRRTEPGETVPVITSTASLRMCSRRA